MRSLSQVFAARNFRTDLTSTVATALCWAMVQPVAALAAAPIAAEGSAPTRNLSRPAHEDKVLHALNRFTFGPRPGDEARVRAMGLDKWFEQQLNPASIDDAAFEERMLEFPAMQMKSSDLLKRYPQPNLIKRIAYKEGGPTIPHDPVLQAIYKDQAAYYYMSREGKVDRAKAEAAASAEGTAPAKGGWKKTANAPEESAMKDDMQSGAAQTPEAKKQEVVSDAARARNFNELVPRMPQAQVDELIALPADARFQRIIAMKPMEVFSLFKSVRFNAQSSNAEMPQGIASGMSPLQKETLQALMGSGRMMTSEVLQARLMRDIYSERQLEAVMTDFWLNHFNVYIGKNNDEVFMLPSYERDVIRKHALGKFEDLLVATATAPAMLMYLDNFLSIGPHSKSGVRGAMYGAKNTGLNENYARELMELHTLGVNGGYTQHDVTEVAKVFTGWTTERYGDKAGTFDYNDQRHEPGTKQVLGQVIGQSGETEGHQVLHILATSPATAQFISRKLAVRFVSDNPPQSLVNAMAKAYLASNGDIKEVLRAMYKNSAFWTPEVYRAKLKTPLEYVVSAVRVSGANVENALPLSQSLRTLGMPLYGMQTPNGYAWDQDKWLSTSALVNRMNFALVLSTNRLPGSDVDWSSMMTRSTVTGFQPVSMETGNTVSPEIASKERSLEHIVLGFPASNQTRSTVLSQENDNAARQAAKDFSLGGPGPEGMGPDAMSMVPQNRKGGAGGGLRGRAAMAILGRQDKTPTDPQAATMAGLLIGSPEFQRR